jgi:hypothetical protein
MDFALCPDQGPPRLIRFLNDMPADVVAMRDPKDGSNIVFINKQIYDLLDGPDQNRALTLRSAVLLITEDGVLYMPRRDVAA